MTATEEEERKKKRLEKFGPVGAPTQDASEIDKKKAERAARFGLSTTPAKLSTTPVDADPEKLRKRAERFGLGKAN